VPESAKSVPARRLWRTERAAEYLGVSVWTLRKLIETGELPVVRYKENAKFLVDLEDLDRFIERNKRTMTHLN
jgi:excisionase family DNA binding protein